MKFLLDTNICIYIIKKKPPEVLEKFKKYTFTDNTREFSRVPNLKVVNWVER